MSEFFVFANSPAAVAARAISELKRLAGSKSQKSSGEEGLSHVKVLEDLARQRGLSWVELNRQVQTLQSHSLRMIDAPFYVRAYAVEVLEMTASSFSRSIQAVKRESQHFQFGFPFLTLEFVQTLIALNPAKAASVLAPYFKAYWSWKSRYASPLGHPVLVKLEVHEEGDVSFLSVDATKWALSKSPSEMLAILEMDGANGGWEEQSHGYLLEMAPEVKGMAFATLAHAIKKQLADREDSGLSVFVRLEKPGDYFDALLAAGRSKDLAEIFVDYVVSFMSATNVSDPGRNHFKGYVGLNDADWGLLQSYYADHKELPEYQKFIWSLNNPFFKLSTTTA